MNVQLHRRRASRLTWWILGVAALVVAIAGSIAYGWTIVVVLLVAGAITDFPLIGGLEPVRSGSQVPKMSERPLKPNRIWLHNVTHSTPLAFMTTAIGALLWSFSVPAGREVFFAGISWILHMATERLFFDHYFPDDGAVIGPT